MVKRLKQIYISLLTILICISGSIIHATNSIGIVCVYELSLRQSASSSSTELLTLPYGQAINITGNATENWYSATIYNNNQLLSGYVYKKSIIIYSADSTFESKISSFPNSYKQSLRYLHCLNSSWNFEVLNTNLDFNTAVTGFQKGALVDGSDEALRENNTVIEGSSWYRANSATVSYFLDPRNFLIGARALMFEKLSYDSTQTLAQVEETLKDTYMSTLQSGDSKTFAQMFFEAGTTYKISPIYLAIMALQEQGTSGTGGLGSQGGMVEGDNTIYYNVFNVGATTGAQDGIVYAKNKGWTTREASINGGAQYLASSYINAAQQSLYLKRFNVNPQSTNGTYSHSYMTNIRAPYSEAIKACKSYLKINKMNASRTLLIPVYTNMPDYTVYPGTIDRLTLDGSSPNVDCSTSTTPSTPTTPTYAKGDVDGSGTISAVDYMVIKNHIMNTTTLSGDKLARADVNGDGSVTSVDYMLIKNHIMGVSKLG